MLKDHQQAEYDRRDLIQNNKQPRFTFQNGYNIKYMNLNHQPRNLPTNINAVLKDFYNEKTEY